MLTFQQSSGSIDPLETAKAIAENVSALTLQKIKLETQIATSEKVGVQGRPVDKYVQAQLAAVTNQLDSLRHSLAGVGPNTISEQLKLFELLKLREQFSENIYVLARQAYEEARKNSERQQSYIAVVVPPSLPDEAAYPKLFVQTGMVFVACLVLWGICSMIVGSIRDSLS
jgi:capsular polysaccharide transport system permease protein